MIFIKNCTKKEFKMEFKRENNECYKIVKKRKYNSEKIELQNELKSPFFVSENTIEFYESYLENTTEFENTIEFYESDLESEMEIESEIGFKSKEFISDESEVGSEVGSEVESEVESEIDEDLIDDMDIDPDMDLRSVDENDYGYYDEYDLGYEDECYECLDI